MEMDHFLNLLFKGNASVNLFHGGNLLNIACFQSGIPEENLRKQEKENVCLSFYHVYGGQT